jgi:hypothetical protein
MTTPSHKNPAWLRERLLNAIKSFNSSADQSLLEDEEAEDGQRHGSVGERAIAHRLAVHLEIEMGKQGYPNEDVQIAVDCEYNRHRGAVKVQLVKSKLRQRVEAAKKHAIKKHPEKKGWYVFSVNPDIIVHERGVDDNNLIVIEVKCASNTIDDELDNIKLQLFTTRDYEQGYGYIFGASAIAYDDDKFGVREIRPGKFFVDPKLRA